MSDVEVEVEVMAHGLSFSSATSIQRARYVCLIRKAEKACFVGREGITSSSEDGPARGIPARLNFSQATYCLENIMNLALGVFPNSVTVESKKLNG